LYSVPSLSLGRYRVEVKSPGMQTVAASGLVLEVGSTVTQNFTLKVASASEIVEITATAPVLQDSTMSVGQVINSRTVQEIPLNGRHFVDLGLLVAGSVTPPQNGFLTAPLRGQGSFAINTAGNREDSVNFMINGINLNDMAQNQITFQPSISTVQEFKLDNQSYSAEYGRNSGAIVNIATRSGTNNYHGSGFEFLRNNYFDARNFFNPVGKRESQLNRNIRRRLRRPHQEKQGLLLFELCGAVSASGHYAGHSGSPRGISLNQPHGQQFVAVVTAAQWHHPIQ
jgi:outer membrane receptor protein involved in Fe transport